MSSGQRGGVQNGDRLKFRSRLHTLIVEQEKGIRTLQISPGLCWQSAYDVRRPQRLVIAYTRLVMLALGCLRKPRKILVIGIGGGSTIKHFHRNLQHAQVVGVDLDPEVISLSRRYFDVPEDPRLHLLAGDGRQFLEGTRATYDLILLDTYSDMEFPRRLTTLEFLRQARSRLSAQGVVVANLWGTVYNPHYPDMIATYREVFEEVHTVRGLPGENRVVLAFGRRRGLDREALAQCASQVVGAGDLRDAVLRGYEGGPAGGSLILDE